MLVDIIVNDGLDELDALGPLEVRLPRTILVPSISHSSQMLRSSAVRRCRSLHRTVLYQPAGH